MTFNLSTGEIVIVEFYHLHDPVTPRATWGTAAKIWIGARHWGAMSRLHPKDCFSKVAGRKAALRRALASTPRQVRKEIWKALIEKGMRVA